MAGTTVLACRVGDDLFAYRDRCASLRRVAGRRGVAPPVGGRRRARCCAARAAAPTSTSCTPGAGARRDADALRISTRCRCWSATACSSVAVATVPTGCRHGDDPVRVRRAGADPRRTGDPPQPDGERCEMCAEPIADEHQHVVNVEGRQLMCMCRGCYLLFTDTNAALRYRAVPDRYLSFPEFALGRREWEALQIPVGLAFFFRNSVAGPDGRVLSGPGGRHRVRTGLTAWDAIRGADAAGGHAGRRRRGAARAGARATSRRPPAVPSGPDRRLLRVRRPTANALARLRRRPGGARRSSTSSSTGRRRAREPMAGARRDRRDVRGPRRFAGAIRGRHRC